MGVGEGKRSPVLAEGSSTGGDVVACWLGWKELIVVQTTSNRLVFLVEYLLIIDECTVKDCACTIY